MTSLRRRGQLRRLRAESFDVVVIGGGITGAATARDAARRGFRTALVEAGDFGQGTSSRSSRLVHGGLRYLEQLEFDLVFEASRERRILLRIAPHLVRPLEFLFPIYRDGDVGKLKLDAGMWLYDALAVFRNIERHRMLDSAGILEREPQLRPRGLLGGARYFDAQVDDARLVLATVRGAAEAGAAVANRVEALGLEWDGGAASGVRVRADRTGREWTIPASVVLAAAGPWTDDLLRRAESARKGLIRPTRGSHIQVRRERIGHDRALIFESPVDGRIMFVLPWRDLTIIGTTDDDHEGVDPGGVVPTAADVRYLLDSANGLFPRAELDAGDILGAWAGLRPLVARREARTGRADAERAGAEEEISRDFAIVSNRPGIFAIAGGKLTSNRSMAEKLVDRAETYLRRIVRIHPERGCDTDTAPLPGGEFSDREALREEIRARAAGLGVSADAADRLARAHGTRAPLVLERIERRPELGRPLAPGRPCLAAEVIHAVRSEMALHLEDVLYRRTRVALEAGDEFETALARAAELMGEELCWNTEEKRGEMERVRRIRARNERFRGALAS